MENGMVTSTVSSAAVADGDAAAGADGEAEAEAAAVPEALQAHNEIVMMPQSTAGIVFLILRPP
jgi:hypothetical protein